MALHVSTISRNLNARVMYLGLEIEDLMIVLVLSVAAMLIGQVFFGKDYLSFLPMNYALALIVCAVSIPALVLLKYGKPAGYTVDLLKSVLEPKAYSCLERDCVQIDPYLTDVKESEHA